MLKISTIAEAHPQFVKATVLSWQFKKYGFDEVLVHTRLYFDENIVQIFYS